ncbi:MAG: NAD(+) diphosphatase [Armatimonadetes bacterium]|nr:NAD(+) diphosphatase [Armatimonadota bacterium]
MDTPSPAPPQAAFVRAYPPMDPPTGPALWLLLRDGEVLVRGGALIESEGDPRGDGVNRTPLYLGTLGGRPCLADDLGPQEALPEGCRLVPLRALFGQIGEAEFALAGYASQMLYWRRTSGFCPVCGHEAEMRPGDWGRRCPRCGHVAYPHVTPAVLILVHDGGARILLGHKPGWGPRYSILAGFVEPGESLEECVRREVQEEAGLEVADLVYAGSQPWPYPHQLMIGFTARHAAGEPRVDAEELDDARWFTAETLPDLPPPVSLSRQMIDAWTAAQTK